MVKILNIEIDIITILTKQTKFEMNMPEFLNSNISTTLILIRSTLETNMQNMSTRKSMAKLSMTCHVKYFEANPFQHFQPVTHFQGNMVFEKLAPMVFKIV